MPENNRTLSADTRVTPATRQVAAQIGGEYAILNLVSGMYHGLEEVGARIWEMISEGTTVGDLEERLVREYDVDPDVLHRDLDALLGGLLDRGLIEADDDPPSEPET